MQHSYKAVLFYLSALLTNSNCGCGDKKKINTKKLENNEHNRPDQHPLVNLKASNADENKDQIENKGQLDLAKQAEATADTAESEKDNQLNEINFEDNEQEEEGADKLETNDLNKNGLQAVNQDNSTIPNPDHSVNNIKNQEKTVDERIKEALGKVASDEEQMENLIEYDLKNNIKDLTAKDRQALANFFDPNQPINQNCYDPALAIYYITKFKEMRSSCLNQRKDLCNKLTKEQKESLLDLYNKRTGNTALVSFIRDIALEPEQKKIERTNYIIMREVLQIYNQYMNYRARYIPDNLLEGESREKKKDNITTFFKYKIDSYDKEIVKLKAELDTLGKR
ncbi:hypothetical protein [Candidatus Cardinium sp. cByotN1]|uniref:hypothetical protein n=1 Tax=Candidatus Cardinium sp. cByotN1 TaxID=2699439 RepID=UPI001FB1EA8A|nr:hypothetical protein [Candidatus Cardinium sp. cByotN1]